MSVQLTIGQRAPLCRSTDPGPKTLFIMAETNWPAAVGQVEPSVPLDIDIEIEQKHGGVYQRSVMCLPNTGLKYVLHGEEVNVYAFYSPRQALAVPYNVYNITGSIINGTVPPSASTYAIKILWGTTPFAYPAAGPLAIPPFVSEYRIMSSSYGFFSFREHNNVGIAPWVSYFDFQESIQWSRLNPIAYLWSAYIYARSAEAALASDFCLEFR